MTTFRTLRHPPLLALLLGASIFGSGNTMAQTVFGDVVAKGSLCVGLDCPDKPSFGSDTIILRENNLRIFFDDTSVSTFPKNKWRMTVNSDASGGASFFAIDDVTATKQPFRISAGARDNSIFVDPTGNVGFGTATPALATHARNGNTPAHRLEQDTSSGWTAQTWDIAGNEANFFVRDVTGGSRLPFRIRPGAPTSSIDISASGSVGVGTASPTERLHVVSSSAAVSPLSVSNADATNYAQVIYRGSSRVWSAGAGNGSETTLGVPNKFFIFDTAAAQARLVIDTSGNVGVGTTAPAARLHTLGSVRFAGVANCGSGIQSNVNGDLSCLASSRQFKNIAGDLTPNVALANIMALRPQTGAYKETPDVPEHWLIAEEVAAVDPALTGLNDGKPYVVKTQNVVADLIAVVQQQQRQIDELRRLVSAK